VTVHCVESVEDLSDPIKLKHLPIRSSDGFLPEGFLAADNGAIHDVYASSSALSTCLRAGRPPGSNRRPKTR